VTDIICGVDVSSAHLDACIGRDGPSLRVGNDASGIAELADFCRCQQVALVVMEATGGYERQAFALLWAEGVACAIANPRAVRRFAEGMGFLEKTDRLDAGLIAWYGQVTRIAPRPPSAANQQRLRALAGRLRQLTALKVLQTNQRRLVDDAEVLASIDEVLAVVRRQTRELCARIATLIEADPLWQALDQAFRQIKGVADRTVITLLAEFAEIGTLSNKAAGKLAGLAPLARDSGKRNGRRAVRGGRSPIRAILFVVAEVVRRHDPDFAAFHRRLQDAGKPKKLIRVALAHKLLVRLNAKARDARKLLANAT
jgi:transposase